MWCINIFLMVLIAASFIQDRAATVRSKTRCGEERAGSVVNARQEPQNRAATVRSKTRCGEERAASVVNENKFQSLFGLQAKNDSAAQPKPSTEAKPASNELPPGFFLDKEPEGTKSVEDAKAAAKTGEKIVVRGRIGGSASPFVEGRAVFTIVGRGIKACSDNPGDHCKQPWDYCCETPETIAKHSATIQIVDSAGTPLKLNLKGKNGLKELSDVVVMGTVRMAKDQVLIVSAAGLYLAKP